MLNYYFQHNRKGKKLFQSKIYQELDSFSSSKIIKKIQKFHQAAKKNEKAKWLSLLSSDYLPQELKNMGFKFSKSQLRRSKTMDFDHFREKKRHGIADSTKEKVALYFKNETTPAANRTIKYKRKGEIIVKPVRYISCCIRCSYPLNYIKIFFLTKIYINLFVSVIQSAKFQKALSEN